MTRGSDPPQSSRHDLVRGTRQRQFSARQTQNWTFHSPRHSHPNRGPSLAARFVLSEHSNLLRRERFNHQVNDTMAVEYHEITLLPIVRQHQLRCDTWPLQSVHDPSYFCQVTYNRPILQNEFLACNVVVTSFTLLANIFKMANHTDCAYSVRRPSRMDYFHKSEGSRLAGNSALVARICHEQAIKPCQVQWYAYKHQLSCATSFCHRRTGLHNKRSSYGSHRRQETSCGMDRVKERTRTISSNLHRWSNSSITCRCTTSIIIRVQAKPRKRFSDNE